MTIRMLPALAVCLSCAAPAAFADDVTAANPLISPLFSLTPDSPEIVGGVFAAGDLLRVTPLDPNLPTVIVTASALSLTSPIDNVDALSFLNPLTIDDLFLLIFSVDADAVGAEPPDPNYAVLGFPFNVQDQAAANQASGDAFASTRLFRVNGPEPIPGDGASRGPRAGASNNSILVVNQGDAGGVDFLVTPSTVSPTQSLPPGTPKGNVNAGAGTMPPPPPPARAGAAPRQPQYVLYTLSRNSPSLGQPPCLRESGADIYIDTQLEGPGGEERVVVAEQIGLVPQDDIDALIIFDDGDGMLQLPLGQDRIVFSLAPGSPTLITAARGPADLLISNGGGVFDDYASADHLGLATTDNLNMLDFVVCDMLEACLPDWAIGFINPCPGDLDGDGDVDFDDLNLMLAAYGTCLGDAGYLPEADLNYDDCVHFDDLNILLSHYNETCGTLDS